MILVNNPGSWSAVYPQLLHAEWHGWTFTDVIFPFFIWIAGVAMTLAVARRIERGERRGKLMLHAARRSALLFLVGLFLSAYPFFDLATLRIPGVLQRIAICYLIAAALYLYTTARVQAIVIVALMAVYWVAMTMIPVPGFGPGVLEKTGNFAQYVDSLFLTGHMWSQTKTWDPEGIVSTLPSIATAMFGVFAGHLLRARMSADSRTAWMFAAASGLMAVGLILSIWMPINKSLWTPPYAVLMAGIALNVFAVCYWLIDVRGYRQGTRPFAVYGMNAIVVYVLSGVLADTLQVIQIGGVALKTIIFNTVFVPVANLKFASLLFAIANVLLLYGVAYLMYRRRWFMRL
jgi:predicted acyltransferase